MTRRASFYVRWLHGALELTVSGDTLEVRAANGRIVFEPRSVTVEARYAYKKEIEDRNRKNLYVGFQEPLQPLNPPRVDIVGRNYVGNFEVIYTNLDFEAYLTVITPASHLYDYAVITTQEVMIQMPAKRKLYYEEEPYERLVVYFV